MRVAPFGAQDRSLETPKRCSSQWPTEVLEQNGIINQRVGANHQLDIAIFQSGMICCFSSPGVLPINSRICSGWSHPDPAERLLTRLVSYDSVVLLKMLVGAMKAA